MSIESNLEIIGGQILGEKAEMLQAHEPAIKEVFGNTADYSNRQRVRTSRT